MKKLILVPLVLLLLLSLSLTAFADLILPPQPAETEAPAPAATEALSVTTGPSHAPAQQTSDAEAAGSALPYLALGIVVLAAAFLLYRSLRKPAR